MNEHSRKWMKPLVSMLLLGSVAIFSGCGGSDAKTTPAEAVLTGTFVDAPVEGLRFKTPSLAGTTNAAGEFNYNNGQTVEFFIGNLKLGEATGGSVVTPVEIVASSGGVITPEVVRVLQLLQSLDSDGNASNGITISPEIQAAFSAEATFDTSNDDGLNAAITIAQAVDDTILLVTTTDATAHFNEKSYVDYLGNTRTATATPGLSEYHTGTGYGKTLFDSADKKCQNCHNELYDTWKSSMHGKSWTDPIFQSKFQDFLRIQLANIGAVPSGGVEYTETTFKGAAQTCIKCHAPGAFYAGDVKIALTDLGSSAGADINALRTEHETNLAPFDTSLATEVVSASKSTGKVYKASFQIGHEANQEGINCAFCHSIETIRMMDGTGVDAGQYKLAQDLRNGAVGAIVYPKDTTTLGYSTDATTPHMNAFSRILGPEKYTDFNATPKSSGFDVGKTSDGRYTMHSIDLNSTNGKVHFTGGPFYGPFGVTGKSNENAADQTDRTAHINPEFDQSSANNHHFGQTGKALCLSCHQRTASAVDPASGKFMELCSTWNAVTAGNDTNHNDTDSSPKCQKCHMERIEGKLLHRWAAPDQNWTLANNPALTAHFDPSDPEGYGDENPVAAGWYNSHAFLGASKTGHPAASATAKIQSGFSADVTAGVSDTTLTVTTSIQNLTAHMLPGAHPMRRMLTRVIVKDGTNTPIAATATGISTFSDIENSVQPLVGKTLHSSASTPVPVVDAGRIVDFPGKTADLSGAAVLSQNFDQMPYIIAGSDSTVKNQVINASTGVVEGNVTKATIEDSGSADMFTRIYGRETGKVYDGVFIVRPGFDSNTAPFDNRLAPNEKETYTLTYDVSGKTGITVTYKVYYMQKGANGSFPATAEGWLDSTVNAEKKLLITEVFTKTVNP